MLAKLFVGEYSSPKVAKQLPTDVELESFGLDLKNHWYALRQKNHRALFAA